MTVAYSSLENKQIAYLRETIPEIFLRAVERAKYQAKIRFASPVQLHEVIRTLRYVSEDGPQDDVEDFVRLLRDGGDCEDYAALMLGEAWRHGWPARLVTAGDLRDNFRHAYIEIFDGGNWMPADPKGNQRGFAYGQKKPFAIERRFELRDRQVVELAQGSGYVAADFIPRSARKVYGDLWQASRLNEDGVMEYVGVSAEIAAQINAQAAVQYTGPGAVMQPATGPYREAQAAAVKLVDDDKFLAALIASEIPLDQLEKISVAMGLMGNEAQKRQGIADFLILAARSLDRSVRQLLLLLGVPAPSQDDVLGSAGLFDGIGQKISDAYAKGGEILRAVQTGVGVALQQVGRAVHKLEQKAPWFGTFVSRPLGLYLQATVLEELGNAVRDGSLSTFNEKKVARATAKTLTAAGQACVVAGSMPPLVGTPYGLMLQAIGTASIITGKAINTLIDAEEAKKLAKQQREVRPVVEAQSYPGVYQRDWGAEWGVLWTNFDAGGNPTHVYVENEWRALRQS